MKAKLTLLAIFALAAAIAVGVYFLLKLIDDVPEALN